MYVYSARRAAESAAAIAPPPPSADKGRQKAEMRNANGIPFSGRYHLSRGSDGEKNRGGTRGPRKSAPPRRLHSRRSGFARAVVVSGMYFTPRTRPLISLILNIL